MIWDLAAHPLLDPPDLGGGLLTELTELAEMLHGLRDYTAGDFSDTEAADLKRGLALQVSLSAAQNPEAFLASSVGRGAESVSYRDGMLLHPTTVAIVDAILNPPDSGPGTVGGSFTILQSYR